MSRLTTWWNQPDQYDWISTFLRQRGGLPTAQRVMAIVCGLAALVPLTVLSIDHRSGAGVVLMGWITSVFTAAMAIFWLARWPTRRQSEAAVVIGVMCVGGWSIVQPAAALAALACTPLAVTGAYIAIFHRAKLMVFNAAVGLPITLTAVLRLAREENVAVAISTFWLINFANLSVPLAVWGMSRAVGMYARRSEEDALTGLLNRRAFVETVSNHLGNPPLMHTHLAVVMVDLDNFKRINDTHGHAAGDNALREVADLLREHAPADAAICRAGGEEFLIALTCSISEVAPLAARICTAIAALSPRVTASVGTASAELRLLRGIDVHTGLQELITVADNAMYDAKRSGGNRAHHSARMRM